MDHPYLYPDEAPWTEDYFDLIAVRRFSNPFIPNNPTNDYDENYGTL